MKATMIGLAVTGAICAFAPQSIAATFVEGTAVASPAQFVSFDPIGVIIHPSLTYMESGIQVTENPGPTPGRNEIWTMAGSYYGMPGLSWYPNGGDTGYVSIREADGSSFKEVSLLTGSGFLGGTWYLNYRLLNRGATVLSGSIHHDNGVFAFAYAVSFVGGGFDEVRLSSSTFLPTDPEAGERNLLTIDSIRVNPIPEPETYAMLIAGLGMLGRFARRRRSADSTPDA